MHLVRAATATLEEDASATEAAVAVAALVAAVEGQIDVGNRVARLLWVHLQKASSSRYADDLASALGRICDQALVTEIAATCASRHAGRDLRARVMTLLAIPRAAAMLSDAALLALVDSTTGRLVYDLAHVVLAAAEARRLDPGVVRSVIAYWRSRSREDVHSRIAACDLIDLIPRDERKALIEHILAHDPSSRVRGYCALRIPDLLAPEGAAAVIEVALASEQHEAVRQDLRRAQADVTESYRIGRLSK